MSAMPDIAVHPTRILIVDDQRHNREVLEVMLAAEDYRLDEASSVHMDVTDRRASEEALKASRALMIEEAIRTVAEQDTDAAGGPPAGAAAGVKGGCGRAEANGPAGAGPAPPVGRQ